MDTLIDSLVTNEQVYCVQFLLDNVETKGLLQDSRVTNDIANFLNERFLTNPSALKALLWQGFDPKHSDFLVQNVPCFHVALSLLGDMIRDASTQRQLLAWKILVKLATKYRLPQSLDLLRLALGQLPSFAIQMLDEMPSEEVVAPVVELLPQVFASTAFSVMNVRQVVAAFPGLGASCMNLLSEISSLLRMKLSRYPCIVVAEVN